MGDSHATQAFHRTKASLFIGERLGGAPMSTGLSVTGGKMVDLIEI